MTTPTVDEQRRLAVERLDAAGLPTADLLAAASLAARLVGEPGGASQLGGRPRMPAGWSWPQWEGRPLQYLARVDLHELSCVLRESGRQGPPASGQLHLMADAVGEGWGFDPAHRGSFWASIVDDRAITVER